MIRAGYVQFTPAMYDVAGNIEALQALLSRSLDTKPDLLVFPELALTGYAYTTRQDLAQVATEENSALTKSALEDISRKWSCAAVMGYPEVRDDRFYNSAIVANSGEIIGNYQKTHLFGGEADVYESGESGFQVFNTSAGRVGVMICFDWFFPESARTLALKGAQIIAHPSNLVMPYCQRAMFARSLENMVYTITANRCGTEVWGDPLTFTGGSIIYDPRGNVLSRGRDDEDHVELVSIDPEKASSKDLNRRNNMVADRRPPFYDTLLL